MEFITQLWLPILVSAVVVFMASSVIWMATPLHKKDYGEPPDKDGVLEVMRRAPFSPGVYCFPWTANYGAAMKDPAFMEKWNNGPWATLVVPPRQPSFARSLVLWFINLVVVGALVAFVAASALPMNSVVGSPEYLHVFRVVGGTAFLGHAGMAACESIWMGHTWRYSMTKVIDGLIYALLTAGVFAWLWPRGSILG